MAKLKAILEKTLARTADEIKKYRRFKKILPSLIAIILLILIIAYIAAILYSRFGSYTVTINKFDNVDAGLSLSETPDFLNPITRLNAKAAEDITNISENQLPDDLDTSQGGVHNGRNYLAYTYYLKNTGDIAVTYEYYMYIVNVTNDIDKAIRVRLYVDGEYVNYARTKTDGTGPEENTTAFKTETTIVREQIQNFQPGDVTRFTVVMWLEGPDADCVDALKGGQFKIDMQISVVAWEKNKTANAFNVAQAA